MKADSFKLIQLGSDYFDELVRTGINERGFVVSAPVVKYLGNILAFYVDARNLHEPEYDEFGRKNPRTLAEIWLTAQTAEVSVQSELLKKLGDRTLYISGFFAESLNRSLVDLDYYCAMGTAAYKALAYKTDQLSGAVFEEMSARFLDFVEVLNVISQDSFAKTDQGILRLYETYLRTGSGLAKERLEELGVFVNADANLKKITGQ